MVDFSNLSAAALFDLRKKLEDSDCLLKVCKKTLLEKALAKLTKNELAEKIKEIKVQLALIFGFQDEIMPAKICWQFSQENESLKILGGVFGQGFLAKDKVIELAKLGSKKEVLTRLAAIMTCPFSGFVNVLKGNLRNLVFILKQIKVKQ